MTFSAMFGRSWAARRRTVSLSAWLLVAFTLGPGWITNAADAAGSEERQADGRPIELVETRPIESSLGNPALRPTREVWSEMIGRARRSLDLEEFYLSDWPHEALSGILRVLGEAARRGVRVCLLLDAGMYRNYPMPADSHGRVAGITVRRIDFRRIAGGIQHSKYFVVDGEEAFLGSQNLDWRSLEHIHELGVRVRDPRLARALDGIFEMDWAASDTLAAEPARASAIRDAASRVRAAVSTRPLLLVQAAGDTVSCLPSWSPPRQSPDSTLWDRDVLVRLLDSARKEIVLQTLTYSPESREGNDPALDDALRRAAGRGVDVRMIISDWESSRSMDALKALARVTGIQVRLSTVPEWSGGYIPYARVEHLKYAVVDTSAAWIGTSNWDPSYFHNSRNVALTFWNRPLAAQARAVFSADWNAPGSHAVKPDSTYVSKAHGMEAPDGRKVYGR